ncbi:hypothetical protein CONLIGDRAFT_631053, partial [Coniochaeta ligniaria NRRL 30616]
MSPLRWKVLPLELRRMILEKVGGHKSFALYAAVSHEWQLFFEEITFHRLVLSSDDL